MKHFLTYLLLFVMPLTTFAQQNVTVAANNEDISQSLDLRIVAQLFGEAQTTEKFEMMLNNPDSVFSNLDLNGDGKVDYLRVIETGQGKQRLIVIQAVLAKDIFQDVASIYVEKNDQQETSVQIIGDEYVYGTNYIIEPVYIYRPLIYDWLWSGRWYSWYSPWYWGYYPSWWYMHRYWEHNRYWNRCYAYHRHHHHCSFHHGHNPHHGYHTMHSGTSRQDYATRYPDNSFSRRNAGMTNARDIRPSRNGTNARNRQTNQIVTGQLTRTVRTHQNTQQIGGNQTSARTPNNINRTSTTQASHRSTKTTSRQTQFTQRSGTQQRPTNHSGNVQRSSQSNHYGSRSSDSVSRGPSPTRSSGGSGSIQRSGGSPSRSSGGGHSGGHRR